MEEINSRCRVYRWNLLRICTGKSADSPGNRSTLNGHVRDALVRGINEQLLSICSKIAGHLTRVMRRAVFQCQRR